MWKIHIEKIAGGFLCFLFVLLLMTCCERKLSLSERYEILPEKPDGFALSKNVILVADNQHNYLYGDPVWLRSGLTDKFVKVAIRPVQQDLYGQDMLRWVLELYGSRMPVIHLGDACNMACSGEFEEFLEIMSAATKPWVMAPGNHDAYLFGNMHLKFGDETWTSLLRPQNIGKRPITFDDNDEYSPGTSISIEELLDHKFFDDIRTIEKN